MGQTYSVSNEHPTRKERKKKKKLLKLNETKKNGIDRPKEVHYAIEKAVQTCSDPEDDLTSVNTDIVFCFDKEAVSGVGRHQSQTSSYISLLDYRQRGNSKKITTPEISRICKCNDTRTQRNRSQSFTSSSVPLTIGSNKNDKNHSDNSSVTSYLARKSSKTSDYESSNSYTGVPVQINGSNRYQSTSVDFSLNSIDIDANPETAHFISNLNLEELCQTNEEFYPMDNQKRGDCIIFNVAHIGGTVRAGTEKDVSRIQGSFRHLGFDVHVKHDPSKSEIKNVIRNYVDKDHSQEDCFACVILSHGKEGHVFAANEEAVCLDEIMDPVKKCSTLIGKPKLFFIQACRGTNSDHGVIVTDAAVDLTGSNIKKLSTHSDVLVSYATVQDFVAYRDVNEGSIYIRVLTELLQKEAFLMKLTDLLNKVNNVTSKVFARSNFCQVPSYTSTFRKSLQFTQRKKIIKKVSTIYYDDGTEEEAIEPVDGVFYI